MPQQVLRACTKHHSGTGVAVASTMAGDVAVGSPGAVVASTMAGDVAVGSTIDGAVASTMAGDVAVGGATWLWRLAPWEWPLHLHTPKRPRESPRRDL